ncbi:hypothetical protein C5E51_31445 [Nocardia nova]|uniref:hypothetical protein n=1 Tax=Nocardia nova TaxID=37330 RepID=UPI0007EB6998|nr:hypothetical protein [Nocardia nova]OBF84413.1 hypothetical protein A9X06_15135 [Mycobacterium sp. 852002-51759_SCH5129042]PPJ02086.1 hypothetical protein C5E51_31445 [Nocardia nova]
MHDWVPQSTALFVRFQSGFREPNEALWFRDVLSTFCGLERMGDLEAGVKTVDVLASFHDARARMVIGAFS